MRRIAEAEPAWWAAVQAYGPEHPALVSTRAIAEAMGRSPATVRWWRWRGTFPAAVLVGGRLRHIRREVQAWAVGRRAAETAPGRIAAKEAPPA